MKPDVKLKLSAAFQLAFDVSENPAERNKIYKIALNEFGIKLQYMNDNFSGLKSYLL